MKVIATGIVAGIMCLALAGCSKASPSASTATTAGSTGTGGTTAPTTPSTTSPPTTVPPTTTTTAAMPVVLWQQTGSGIESGQQFTVPSSVKGWNEVWTYNCASFGSSGNFITNINGYGGAADTTDSGTNQEGNTGSGTNHYYDTGTFSIDVNSECNWTDEAVTVP